NATRPNPLVSTHAAAAVLLGLAALLSGIGAAMAGRFTTAWQEPSNAAWILIAGGLMCLWWRRSHSAASSSERVSTAIIALIVAASVTAVVLGMLANVVGTAASPESIVMVKTLVLSLTPVAFALL